MESLRKEIIFFNGRPLTKKIEGVPRVVSSLLQAIDRELLENPRYSSVEAILLVPKNGNLPDWTKRLAKIKLKPCGSFSGNLWEQFDLFRYSKNGLLVNLGNTAPLLVQNQVVMVHDANVYRVPGTYSWVYAAWHRMMHFVFRMRRLELLTVSRWSASELSTILGIRPERIKVIPNACDHICGIADDDAVLSTHGLDQHRFALLIGAAAPHKNIAAIISAIESYQAAGIKVVVVGERNQKHFQKIADAKTAGVIWTGRISDEQLRSLLRNALCLLFPSRYEGFGLPTLEAMILGCPVVASNIPVLREVCGEAALYADVNDPGEFLARTVELFNDKTLWESRSQQGILHAGAFRWQYSASLLLDNLKKTLGAR